MKKKISTLEKLDIYWLKRMPPILVLKAEGLASSTGWSSPELVLCSSRTEIMKGIYRFDFVGIPPEAGGDRMTPIEAYYEFDESSRNVVKMIVAAEQNEMEYVIPYATGAKLQDGGGGDGPRGFSAENSVIGEGSSIRLSFEEALNEAVKNAEELLGPSPIMDGFSDFEVISTKVRKGGFHGGQALHVRVRGSFPELEPIDGSENP